MKDLITLAKKYSQNSYSPYSKIKVGASIETSDGTLFGGCNVENISFGATVCAERVAIFKAISEGHKKITKLCLYTKDAWTPCGICLQVMYEFMRPEDTVIICDEHTHQIYKLNDLLPKTTDLKTFKKLQE